MLVDNEKVRAMTQAIRLGLDHEIESYLFAKFAYEVFLNLQVNEVIDLTKAESIKHDAHNKFEKAMYSLEIAMCLLMVIVSHYARCLSDIDNEIDNFDIFWLGVSGYPDFLEYASNWLVANQDWAWFEGSGKHKAVYDYLIKLYPLSNKYMLPIKKGTSVFIKKTY